MKRIIIILVILLILVVGCADKEQPPQVKPECITNADCVAATCCHASECVAKTEAPNCKEVFCSMECRPYTMDCGQGYCACENKKCVAKITS
ncbi:hypothetical protein KY342_04095 [Candidatus Woesearchaeota archaeon]|nr:hypothetical protein [Candidatus Woesearchaeota archaeon]